VLADDQTIVREGLVTLLGLLPGIEVVGAAPDGAHIADTSTIIRTIRALMGRLRTSNPRMETDISTLRAAICQAIRPRVVNAQDAISSRGCPRNRQSDPSHTA